MFLLCRQSADFNLHAIPLQRKDYSALTKFLPPKFEYVISVRLSPIQMDLYQKHLDRGAQESIISKGARLFKDYQALMRIWTHPWVLKLDEVRQQNKVCLMLAIHIELFTGKSVLGSTARSDKNQPEQLQNKA